MKLKWPVVLTSLVTLTTLVLWLPFLLRIPSLTGWGLSFPQGMETIFTNFDGPNYLIVAKSWYDKAFIGKNFSIPLPLEYYPAHLPLYPFLVSIFDVFLPGTWAMLLITLIGSLLMYLMFYFYAREVAGEKTARWLSLVALIIPARILVVRSIGSPEPWFIFFILSSIYYFRKGKYWLAGGLGALAQLTKSPGILLFAGYGTYFLLEVVSKKKLEVKRWFRAMPLLLIPLVVLPLFWFYKIRTGDFFAYFNSGDNFHLFFPPFSIFSPQGQFWTGDFWLEEIIWLWIIYGLGVIKLWKKDLKAEACFAGIFFISTLFVAHRDVARYILPIAPLVLVGLSEEIVKKEFKWLLILLILPIYLYSWNFVLNNVAPIADWTPYL